MAKRLMTFDDFSKSLNENVDDLKLKSILGDAIKGLFANLPNENGEDLSLKSKDGKKIDTDKGVDNKYNIDRDSYDEIEISSDYVEVKGDDDYLFYLQHQQGVAGITSIIKAAIGKGKILDEVLKTKGGVKYAHIMNNIPPVREKEKLKNNILYLLNADDQKRAAALFLNGWKQVYMKAAKEVKTHLSDPKKKNVIDIIRKAAKKHNIPDTFALTVAQIESGLNPKAAVPNGSYRGLYQMNPNETYGNLIKPLGNDWDNPEKNATAGLKLLAAGATQLKNNLNDLRVEYKGSEWVNNIKLA